MLNYQNLFEDLRDVFRTDQNIAARINTIVGCEHIERQKVQRLRKGKTMIPDHPTGQAVLILHAMYVVKK